MVQYKSLWKLSLIQKKPNEFPSRNVTIDQQLIKETGHT